NWVDNIRDWCISRQLWWGHRIPAYYCDDCGEVTVSKEEPKTCPHCGGTHFKQDPDTLDTWFSSALWPFSTLGWPKETEDLKYFYPTDVLVTGYDIIFFWVIRMIFSGCEQMNEIPFKTVLFHGLVRDSQGRKMSKSLGNGIDPLEVIDKYGADALRLTLVTGNAPGNDMRFYWEQVEASRNFANKIWNASRFIMMNLPEREIAQPAFEDLAIADRWILSAANTLAKEVQENMERYELGIAVSKVHDFLWDEFCDWYIEIAKLRLVRKEEDPKSADAALWTLKEVLGEAMKLLHPFMPFVTEEIYCTLRPEEDTVMTAKWPEYTPEREFPKDEEMIGLYKELVKGTRAIRAEMNVPHGTKTEMFLVGADAAAVKELKELKASLVDMEKMLFATEVVIQDSKEGISEDAVSIVGSKMTAYIPLEELVDREKEIARLQAEQKKIISEIKRAEGMLANPNFVGKAPEKKVAEERAKLEKYNTMKEQIDAQLASYGA
ncbi:MAG: valine--tRNA ligase, partial [Lachnospiraceae bacterium]|nr:valine--tRNA ligase [Lachnospiraceae bacterium]